MSYSTTSQKKCFSFTDSNEINTTVTPLICIIIPTHNLLNLLECSLTSISNTKFKHIIVIVVDNGSSPPIRESRLFKKFNPPHHIIRIDSNVGFAEANNHAIRFAMDKSFQVDYFLLLNNDAYIHQNFFTVCTPYLKKDLVLLSPIIQLTRGRGIDSNGIVYYSDGVATNNTSLNHPGPLLPAAALFVSSSYARKSLVTYGWLFIPLFGSYCEDVELSLRTLLMGMKIDVIPHTVVTHDKSSTITRQEVRDYLGMRNELWTIITTWSRPMIQRNIFRIIEGQMVNNIIFILKFRTLILVKIYLDTIVHLLALFHLRLRIQRYLRVAYPENLLKEDPLTLGVHIRRSRTYRKLSRIFGQ